MFRDSGLMPSEIQRILGIEGGGTKTEWVVQENDNVVQQGLLPQAAFVSPHAPEPCDQAPVGRQWFPLTFRDPNERWTGVNRAAPVLSAFLDAELKRHNLPPDLFANGSFPSSDSASGHIALSWVGRVNCTASLEADWSASRACVPKPSSTWRLPPLSWDSGSSTSARAHCPVPQATWSTSSGSDAGPIRLTPTRCGLSLKMVRGERVGT